MAYVILSAGWNAWWPMALEMTNKPDAARQYARMAELFLAAALWLTLGIGLFAPEILAWFTRAVYVPAAPYALILLIYYGPLSFLGSNFQIGLYARKQTHWISIAFIVAAMVNVGLNLLWDRAWGVWGAVAATIVAIVAWLVCLYLPSQRALPIQYAWGKMGRLALIYSGVVGAFLLVPGFNHLLLKISVLALFPLAIIGTGIVSRRELNLGWQGVWQRLAQWRASGRSV
jgi:O-antigen/teichoic acid export membrane protein